MRCGGKFSLVQQRRRDVVALAYWPSGRLTVVCPHCRQGIGVVVHFVSVRASEAECCQISLTEHVPMGLTVT